MVRRPITPIGRICRIPLLHLRNHRPAQLPRILASRRRVNQLEHGVEGELEVVEFDETGFGGEGGQGEVCAVALPEVLKQELTGGEV